MAFLRLSFVVVLSFIFSSISVGQDSLYMRVLSHWNSDGGEYADVWGYTINGAEIAIIGSETKIYFFDVTNPSNISLIHTQVGGQSSFWRDIKSFGNYVYTVTEGNEGMHIFDMSNAPTSINKVLTTTAFFNSAHNIFIDEANGRLYACGTDTVNKGLVVLSLADPTNPTLLANADFGPGFYVHDLYVKNNIAHCSHGNTGYYVWDFTTPAAPVQLGSYTYTNQGYNHSSWNTADGLFTILAEELPKGKPIRILNISNLSNISLVKTFKEPLLAPTHTNNTPHNPIVVGNWVYISYYEDGVQIFDISNLNNPTRVAYYDTSNNSFYNGTRRVWGVYPLPSGKILASDIISGLYVLEVDFTIPVPVELSLFEAMARDNKYSELIWETRVEINNSHFEIERSQDGKSFQKIGEVEGQGNSNRETTYRFTDKAPQLGNNFYRLKQIDYSGEFEYSEIRQVNFKGASPEVIVYPNPGEGYHISFDFLSPPKGKFQILLTNELGQSLSSKEFFVEGVPVSSSLKVDFPNKLIPGIYHLVVLKNGEPFYAQPYVVE